MIKKITISICLFALMIIGYGIIKKVETEQTIKIINHGSKAINNLKLKPIKTPKINTKRMVKNKVWVNGKTLKECMKGKNEINNNTVKCRSGYFKEIWIWE